MEYIVLVILAVFIMIILLRHYGKKPYKHKNIPQDDLKKYLEVLLVRGFDRGFIHIEKPNDEKFLQFSKYINTKFGLQCDFPLAKWSKEYYDKLKDILYENSIKFNVQKTNTTDVSEFIVIDLKQDLDLAIKVTKLILQDLYGFKDSDNLDLHFKNVSPK